MATASVTNDFVNGQAADADEVDQNFTDIVNFLNSNVAHVDGSNAFTGVVEGITPTTAAHLATKGYVDGLFNACRISKTGAQSISSGAWAQVAFGTEDYNQGSHLTFNNGNDTIDADSAGLWIVRGSVEWGANTSGARRSARILVASSVKAMVQDDPIDTSSVVTQQEVSLIWYASSAQTVELQVLQDSGSNVDVGGGATGTVLEAAFISLG